MNVCTVEYVLKSWREARTRKWNAGECSVLNDSIIELIGD